MQIAVATCAAAPRLDEDRDLLLPALARAGVSVEPVAWNDPAADWDGFDGVLVRSVRDHPAHHAAFLEHVAAEIDRGGRLDGSGGPAALHGEG